MSDSMYDKLGDLLSKALDSGEIPQKQKSSHSNSGDANNGAASSTNANDSGTMARIPVPPCDVADALKTLGLTPDLTYKEAKKLYREKLKQFHPDKNSNHPVIQKIAKEKTESFIAAWNKAEQWYKENRSN